MTRNCKLATLCLALMMSVLQASAAGKVAKVYIYGFAASFNDSTVYMTDIMELDSAWLTSKADFLYARDGYSYQLKSYLTEHGANNPTCVVSYAKKRKDAEKKYVKLRTKYTNGKGGHYTIKYVTASEFTFKPISAADDPTVNTVLSKEEEKARKTEMKKQKEQRKLAEKQNRKSAKDKGETSPAATPPTEQ